MNALHEVLFGRYTPPEVVNTRAHRMDAPKDTTGHLIPDRESRRDQLLAIGLATRNRLKNAMPELAGSTMSEVIAKVHMSRSAVQNHLNALIKEGHVYRKRVSIPGGGYTYQYYPTKTN